MLSAGLPAMLLAAASLLFFFSSFFVLPATVLHIPSDPGVDILNFLYFMTLCHLGDSLGRGETADPRVSWFLEIADESPTIAPVTFLSPHPELRL